MVSIFIPPTSTVLFINCSIFSKSDSVNPLLAVLLPPPPPPLPDTIVVVPPEVVQSAEQVDVVSS